MVHVILFDVILTIIVDRLPFNKATVFDENLRCNYEVAVKSIAIHGSFRKRKFESFFVEGYNVV